MTKLWLLLCLCSLRSPEEDLQGGLCFFSLRYFASVSSKQREAIVYPEVTPTKDLSLVGGGEAEGEKLVSSCALISPPSADCFGLKGWRNE